MYRFLIIIFNVLLILSCSRNAHDNSEKATNMKYAELLSIHDGNGFTVVEIHNPWDTAKLLHRYVLVPSAANMPKDMPKGDIVRTPLRDIAVFSSVHCGVTDELGAFESITGVCDAQYIYMHKVQQGLTDGYISDYGSSMAPNTERIIEKHPDAILLSPYENSGSYGKLGKLGITLIECADYMETSPLGRAEWIKFYGLLLGKEEKADSIFNAVETRYNHIKANAAKKKNRPTVVTEMKNGSTWYIAGGRSTVGQLIADAGGQYVFSDINTSGAQPFSPEKAFSRARGADIWLIKYSLEKDMSLRALGSEWSANKQMKAYKNGNVYGCNLTYAHIYEDTPFHPEIMLAELVNILHPKTVLDHCYGGTMYYKKLAQ